MKRSQLLFLNLLSLLLGCIPVTIIAQSVFPCDERPIVSLNDGGPPSIFYRVEAQTDGSVTFQGVATFSGGFFNALGYNIEDNLIYGWQRDTEHFVRIFPDGSFEVVGTVPGATTIQAPAGDVSSEGVYIYYEQTTFELLFFDIDNGFELLARVPLFWDPASGVNEPFTLRMDDLALDPFESGVVYSYQRNFDFAGTFPVETRGQLLRIDADLDSPTRGRVTPVGLIPPDVTKLMGSMFFNNKGQLFGYGSLEGFPNHVQNRLIAIDKQTGSSSLVGIGPSAPQSDGCSCPYNVVFEKTVNQDTVTCETATLSFTFTLISRHVAPLSGLELLDTLPGNITITNIEGDFTGTVAPDGGVGSPVLHLTDLLLPAGDSISITITTTASFDSTGTYLNQAYLYNLPAIFGDSRASDNPETIGINSDPTGFEVILPTAEEAELSAFPAADCQSLDSSRVEITAGFFIPDSSYIVTYLDPEGTELTITVSAESDSSLVITGLPPGDYFISSILPTGSACQYVLSTSVTVPYATALIEVTASSNSPVCTGDTLQLAGQADEALSLSWTGPDGFMSDVFSPTLPQATSSASGTYLLIANLGFCQAIDSVDVLIQAPIDLTINGPETLCEGSTATLTATGNSAYDSLLWILPNGMVFQPDTLTLNAANEFDDGLYTAIAQSASCTDTAELTLITVASPSVNLPESREINLCESASLSADIVSGADYTLQWSPAGGLSCDDCTNPTITGPIATSYTLTATTAAGCSDSSSVTLLPSLEKELYIPNAFSPNDDGRNDYFELYPGCGVARIQRFQIYSRWGSLLFDAPPFNPHQATERWDGRFLAQALNTDLYTWVVEVLYLDGTRELLSGDVQLVR